MIMSFFYFQSAVLVFCKSKKHSVLKFGEKTRLILSFSSEHALWDGVIESSTLTLSSPFPHHNTTTKIKFRNSMMATETERCLLDLSEYFLG